MLIGIKLLHTLIWAFLAGCILTLPILAVLRRFRWAAIITVVVLLECAGLAINGGRCPLTDLAARYTVDRASNFDIYLPIWLPEHNKFIFGTLFVVGEVVLVACWRKQRFGTSPQRQNCGSYRGTVIDPDGYSWMVGTHKAEPTRKEMKQGMLEMMKQMKQQPAGEVAAD